MSETVSDVVAFLCAEGGTLAEELVLSEDELGLLTPAQRAAAEAARRHAVDTFEALLMSVYEAVRRGSSGNFAFPKRRPGSERVRRRLLFDLYPEPGVLHVGVAIASWGEPTLNLHVWIWVEASHWDAVHAALRASGPKPPAWERNDAEAREQPWTNEYGSFVVTFPPLRAGDRVSDIAENAGRMVVDLVRVGLEAVRGASVLAR